MKAALAILLAACLSVDRVSSLVCWSCNDVDSNWACWRWQFCSSDDNFCATTYTGAGIGQYSSQSISKGCVPVCPSGAINIGIAAVSVKCCSSSLCNISGASGLKTNPVVLVAGVLGSLLYLFVPRM